MNLRLISTLLIALSLNTPTTWSQIIDLSGCNCGQRLRLQHILPDEGRLGSSELLPIRTGYFSDFNSAISFDGNTLIINEQLIKKGEEKFERLSYPFENESNRGKPLLNSDGNTVIIPTFHEFTDNYLNYYNITANSIDFKYKQPYGWYQKHSADGNTMAYISPNEESLGLFVIENYNGSISTSLVLDEVGFSPGISYVSSKGDRIFYHATLNWFDLRHKAYYVDKLDTGWSEPIEFNLYFDELRIPQHFALGYANNARTILTGNTDYESFYELGLSFDIEGKWSEPIRVGIFPFENNHFSISENGKTIVRRSVKRIIPRGGGGFFDLYVNVQNESGKWIEYHVNEPEEETLYYILLSGDGSKLYWRKAGTSSIPEFEAYK